MDLVKEVLIGLLVCASVYFFFKEIRQEDWMKEEPGRM